MTHFYILCRTVFYRVNAATCYYLSWYVNVTAWLVPSNELLKMRCLNVAKNGLLTKPTSSEQLLQLHLDVLQQVLQGNPFENMLFSSGWLVPDTPRARNLETLTRQRLIQPWIRVLSSTFTDPYLQYIKAHSLMFFPLLMRWNTLNHDSVPKKCFNRWWWRIPKKQQVWTRKRKARIIADLNHDLI